MKDRPLLSTTDHKLLFRQQRVRNTRMAIRKLESWFAEEKRFDFNGRVFTNEYREKTARVKFLKSSLKELERDLMTYRNKSRKKFAPSCK